MNRIQTFITCKNIGTQALKAVSNAVSDAGLTIMTAEIEQGTQLDADILLPQDATPKQRRITRLAVERMGMLAFSKRIISLLGERGLVRTETAMRNMAGISAHLSQQVELLADFGVTDATINDDYSVTVFTTRGSHDLTWLPKEIIDGTAIQL